MKQSKEDKELIRKIKLAKETLAGLKSSAEALGAEHVVAKFKDGAIWIEFDLPDDIFDRKETGQKPNGGKHGKGRGVAVAGNPDQGTAEDRRKTQGDTQKGKPKSPSVQRGDRPAGGVLHSLCKRRVRGCGCEDCRGRSRPYASADPNRDEGRERQTPKGKALAGSRRKALVRGRGARKSA